MATRLTDLTNIQLDFLVAKLQGVKVVTHTRKNGDSYCAIEMEFNPDGPANDYDLQSFKMWRFYEPTKDWTIAGPIIQEEKINLSTYEEDGEEAGYWGAWYGDYQHEQDGDTPTEAAIRSYIAKHFGDTIDLENLPKFKRVAIVQINAFCEDIVDEPFAFVELEVEAETDEEAKQLAIDEFKLEHPDHEIIDAYFIRWQ